MLVVSVEALMSVVGIPLGLNGDVDSRCSFFVFWTSDLLDRRR